MSNNMPPPAKKDLMKLNYDIQLEGSNTNVKLALINSSNKLLIITINLENIINEEYSKEFSKEDLVKVGKFFQLFDDINKILEALKEIFENKKPKIQKFNNYMQVIITPIISAFGEANLIIPKKEKNDKDIINNLCNIVNEQGIEINELKKKFCKFENFLKEFEKSSFYRKIIYSDSLIGNIIKNKEYNKLICEWIDKNQKFKFKLLYCGTLDGDTIQIFHKNCDNQGKTISIIQSTDNQIFGGYTEKSWDINNKSDIPDPNSFLFNLNLKKKYPVSNNKGIVNKSGYICDFGYSSFHELWIENNFLSKGGGCDNGDGYNFKNYELSGGKNNFNIKEIEIFKIEFNN